MSKMRKKLTRSRIVFISIVAILMFFILKSSNKNKIVKLVNNNLDFLNECVENKTYDKVSEIKEIKDITLYPLRNDDIYIDFYCYGYGLVPSSVYYGFYYVSNDEPLGFQAHNVKLEADGYGWKWEQANGDNRYYIEKIAENWYYYQASF